MKIEAKTVGTVTLARCRGRLDTETSPAAHATLGELIDEGARKIVLDLSGVGVVSSAGFGVLVAINERLDEAGGALRISGPREVVRELFEMSGYSAHLDVYDTERQAMAGF